ncbi:SPOR domain-containing protein [Variovorax sp. J22R133]|uniref:SPOR domain-containing protein n=1 Tax=Variovorax brevis TaxID=3053503 RepID=UPI00257608E6|nr:SPOR domain-containing protein [Variovorax sp. J22R133]MDM0111873.1 SPOR domain-containing protein [Variovorax sp. J22R133]
MAFFKFRTNGQPGNEGRNVPASAPPAESVEAMRRRARHRLLGAAVLVLLGVIGFPLLFDTQPRPVASDIPIEIPDRAKAKPLGIPATPAPSAAPKVDPDKRMAQASTSGSDGIITENADGSEVVTPAKPQSAPKPEARVEAPKPEPRPEPKPEVKAEAKPEHKPEAKPEPKPEPKVEVKPAAPKPPANDDGARARALLEGSASQVAAKPAAAATADDAGRFIVQVGAFADAAKAREVRQKLEKAGLKTYTNVAKTADGERTRVRVGPFASRADADKAAGKIKDLALPAAVISL